MYYMCNNLPLSRALLLNEQAARLLKIGEGLPATFGFWGGSSGLHTKFLLSMREASVPAGVLHICVLVPTCLQLSLVHGTPWKSFRWVGSEAGYEIWSLGDVWASVHLKILPLTKTCGVHIFTYSLQRGRQMSTPGDAEVLSSMTAATTEHGWCTRSGYRMLRTAANSTLIWAIFTSNFLQV